jgi:hypothetical protein
MFRKIILGLAAVVTICTMTVAATMIGITAATYAIGRATLAVTVTTPAAPQLPTRYVGRFVGRS